MEEDITVEVLAAAVAAVAAVVDMAAASHSSGIFSLYSLVVLTFASAGSLPFSLLEFPIVSLI